MIKLTPTRHAVQRARDRTGWCRHSLERMPERVYYFGLAPDGCCRQMHDYLASVAFGESTRAVRLYGNHVFVFGQETAPDQLSLITILHLPPELRALAHRDRSRSITMAA